MQAAPALAALSHTLSAQLSQALSAQLGQGSEQLPSSSVGGSSSRGSGGGGSSSPSRPPRAAAVPACEIVQVACRALPTLLALATHAAGDNEKVRASGVEALGHAFDCLGPCSSPSMGGVMAASQGSGELVLEAGMVEAAGCALLAGLQSGVPKVQWSACSAAGQLLHACGCLVPPSAGSGSSCGSGGSTAQVPAWVGSLQQLAHQAVEQLLGLLGSCPSTRSRVRAAAALQSVPSVAIFQGSYAELLHPVCQALFQGACVCEHGTSWHSSGSPWLALAGWRVLACRPCCLPGWRVLTGCPNRLQARHVATGCQPVQLAASQSLAIQPLGHSWRGR